MPSTLRLLGLATLGMLLYPCAASAATDINGICLPHRPSILQGRFADISMVAAERRRRWPGWPDRTTNIFPENNSWT